MNVMRNPEAVVIVMAFLVVGLLLLHAIDKARRGPASPRRKDVETPSPVAPPCLPTSEAERRRNLADANMRRLFNDVLATQAGRLGWGADTSGKTYGSLDEFLADEGHRRSVK